MIVRMQPPAGATKLPFGNGHFHVSPDGTLDVPEWAVQELAAAGASVIGRIIDGTLTANPNVTSAIDARGAVARMPDHELPVYLRLMGAPARRAPHPGNIRRLIAAETAQEMRSRALALHDVRAEGAARKRESK